MLNFKLSLGNPYIILLKIFDNLTSPHSLDTKSEFLAPGRYTDSKINGEFRNGNGDNCNKLQYKKNSNRGQFYQVFL